jgi:hypothetical protein
MYYQKKNKLELKIRQQRYNKENEGILNLRRKQIRKSK